MSISDKKQNQSGRARAMSTPSLNQYDWMPYNAKDAANQYLLSQDLPTAEKRRKFEFSNPVRASRTSEERPVFEVIDEEGDEFVSDSSQSNGQLIESLSDVNVTTNTSLSSEGQSTSTDPLISNGQVLVSHI